MTTTKKLFLGGMKKASYVFVIILSVFSASIPIVHGDNYCGGGMITVEQNGVEKCVQCGDREELYWGSNYLESCLNNVGHTYCAPTDAKGTCQMCPDDTTTLEFSSASVTDCYCKQYTFGPPGGPCLPCPAGNICENGLMTTCPAGKVCVDGRAVDCPMGSSSSTGSSTMEDCNICDDGYYLHSVTQFCTKCEQGAYCNNNIIAGYCVDGATSAMGSSDVTDCSCRDGFYFDSGICKACPEGSYCVGGAVTPCTEPIACQMAENVQGCVLQSDTDEQSVCCTPPLISNGKECLTPLDASGSSWHPRSARDDLTNIANAQLVYYLNKKGEDVWYAGSGATIVKYTVDTASGNIVSETLALTYVNNAKYSANPVMHSVYGMAVDTEGNLYAGDDHTNVIYKISNEDTVTPFAGSDTETGCLNNPSDGSLATFSAIRGMTISDGEIYVVDQICNNVRKVDLSTSGVSAFPMYGLDASLLNPTGIAITEDKKQMFISDTGKNMLKKVMMSNGMTSVVGGDLGQNISLPYYLGVTPDNKYIAVTSAVSTGWYWLSIGDPSSPMMAVSIDGVVFEHGLSSVIANADGTKMLSLEWGTDKMHLLELHCDVGFASLMHCFACDHSGQSCGADMYPSDCATGQSDLEAPCLACPAHSHVDAGLASSVSDCVCTSGYYMSAAHTCEYHNCPAGQYNDVVTGDCIPCPANSYCEAFSGPISCQANAVSWAGSSSIDDCTCDTDYVSIIDNDSGAKICIPACASGEYYDTDASPSACVTCPETFFCDTVDKRSCGSNTESDAGSTSFDHCFCIENYYGPISGECQACPSTTWAPARSGDLSACQCAPGTFGPVVDGVPDCTPCTIGHYCPGDGTEHVCPNNQLTLPNLGQSSISSCVQPVCGNGILEGDEECDDGERFDGDGCDGHCRFEDSSGTAVGSEWFCVTELFQRSECCKALVNPVTGDNTCSCAGQDSGDPGYVILSDCSKQDVDECDTNNGGCIDHAVCTNLDGTLESGTHVCNCPPGLIGDGITRCDIFVYETKMAFELLGVSVSNIDEDVLKNRLISDIDAFSDVDIANLLIDLDTYQDSALDRPESELRNPLFDNRRLLQDGSDFGVHLTVVVVSDSSLEMEDVTQSTDVTTISTFLEDLYSTTVTVLADAQNVVLTADRVYGAVNTVLTGFRVDGIVYNTTAFEWLVTVKYVGDSPNTITSMYVSKTGQPPYSDQVQDTFFLSKHPCMTSSSICCLSEYAQDYHIGTFADDIVNEIGTCTQETKDADTLGMFDVSKNDDYLMNALHGLQFSKVTRLNENTLQLHINRFALRNQVAMREPFAGGFEMDFFVGMSYYTMLPTNALATVASQVSIHATATDSATFATTTSQDYTFVEYITMALYQTKYIQDSLIEHYLQFVKVGFVIPETLTQNMKTGLVPLNSVRFAIATSAPDPLDLDSWLNPCYSSDGSGLFDNSSSSLNMLYTEAEHQTCALQAPFCQNPLSPVLQSGLVDFWFPIGDNIIDSDILNSDSQYSLYVYFDLSVVAPNGKKSITKLFGQAAIESLSIARSCETLSAAQTVSDIVEVDLDIGLVGLEEDWDTSMTTFDNLLHKTRVDDILDTTVDIVAPSAASALMTIVVKGNDAAFNNPVATDFHMEIDDMISLHFLENTKYQDMLQLIDAGNAYELVREEGTGYLDVKLTPEATTLCSSSTIPGDFTCALRKDINRRQVVQDYAVHPLASDISSHDEDATSNWIQEYVLGASEFADEFGRNFTRLVRDKHDINDRYNKAWYVNPMYKWVVEEGSGAQSVLALSERTILLAVISLEDENFEYGNVGQRRRFLLQFNSDHQGEQVKRTVEVLDKESEEGQFPPIVNKAVNVHKQAANILRLDDGKHDWATFRADVTMEVPADKDATWVRKEIQSRINANLGRHTKNVDDVRITQFLMRPNEDDASAQRRLLQTNTMQWQGLVTMMINKISDYDGTDASTVQSEPMHLWYNWMRCALYLGDIQTDRIGSPVPDCGAGLSGSGAFNDFITNIWNADVCGSLNATYVDRKCQNIADAIFHSTPPAFAPPTVAPLPVGMNRTGFLLEIDLTDDSLTAETLSDNDVYNIRALVASNFGVNVSQVVVLGVSSGARRRLLDVKVNFRIIVEDDFDTASVDITDVKESIVTDLEDSGYNAAVLLNVAAPEAPVPSSTPVEDDDNDDEDHIIYILIGIVGGVVLIAFFVFLAINQGWCGGTTARESQYNPMAPYGQVGFIGRTQAPFSYYQFHKC